MRLLPALLLAVALSGCVSVSDPVDEADGLITDCPMDGDVTLYLGPGFTLSPVLPAAGWIAGNGFNEAFLTNEMDEWTTPPVDKMVHIMGDLTLHFWSRGHDMAAPVVLGGDPGEGYHWFNQVGTNRGFVEAFAVEYAPIRDEPVVREWTETFPMPTGGLFLEPGDHLRVLLTNLVLDTPTTGAGPEILFGGETPSAVTFQAHCRPIWDWDEGATEAHAISIPAHHGLLTGVVPARDGLNHVDVPFTLEPSTGRLTIALAESGSTNPTKNDMDLGVLDASGAEVWSIGSPYSDDVGTKWPADLAANLPPGDYTVRVSSYSGVAYEGTLTIRQDRLSDAPGSPAP